jgi:aminoglycoside phosphotransferase (APT) family kinase protein
MTVDWHRGPAAEAAWRALDQGGWEYLLPDGRGRRWLCVDVLQGATTSYVAPLCGSLDTVCLDPSQSASARESLRLLGQSNVRVHDGVFPGKATDGQPFDGFLLHDLSGRLDEVTRERCLEAGREALGPRGFLFTTARNSHSYSRLRERAGAGSTTPAALLRQPGFEQATLHPFVCAADGRLLDVIAASGHVSAKNARRLTERLRRFFLGRTLAPYMSPGFGIVTRPDCPPRRLLDLVIDEAVDRRLLAAGATFRRWHVLRGGKVIVSLGTPGRGFGQVIAVFARGPQAVERREREFGMLERLSGLPGDISRHIPRVLYRTDVAGTPAFLMEELQGITLDAPVRQLAAATEVAATFIQRLHHATRRKRAFDSDDFERLVEPWIAAAETRYPPLAQVLGYLRPALRAALAAHHLPVVWMHGDFKVENVIVDPSSSRLVGVIDWEHTQPEGLPFIDLWYLFLYNHEIESNSHFFPAVKILTAPGRLPPKFRRASEEYGAALGIPESAWRALAGAFIAHHIGSRMNYQASDPSRMTQIREAIESWLAWRT